MIKIVKSWKKEPNLKVVKGLKNSMNAKYCLVEITNGQIISIIDGSDTLNYRWL